MKKRTIIMTVLLVVLSLTMVVGLTACKLNLGAPVNVTYDGTVISWDSVALADRYTVQINDGEAREIYGNSMVFDADGKDFTVTVIAMPQGSGKLVKANTTTKDFVKLDTITAVSVSDTGELSWDAVDKATGYTVKVNDVNVATVETTSYNRLTVGEALSVSVRPIVIGNDSYYALWSAPKNMRILTVPQNIVYDNDTIRWDSVANASDYKVVVNSEVKEGTVGASLVYNANNVDFDCTVQAIGDHKTTYDSAISESKKFVYLDTVTNLAVNDGILSWDPIEKATGYTVKVTGNSVANVYEVEDAKLENLPVNVSLSMEVRPICDNTAFFSSYSAAKVAMLLSTPDVKWDSGVKPDGTKYKNIFWDVVNQATGYTAKVIKPDGTEEITVLGGDIITSPSFAYDFDTTGTYKIYIKANANVVNNPDLKDSAYSKVIEVVRLAAPKAVANNAIVSNKSLFKDGMTVTFQSVSNAAKYKLYFNDDSSSTRIMENVATQFVVSSDMFPMDNTENEQRFNIHIQSIGKGATEVEGRIVVSLDSLETLSSEITVLAVPANVRMDGYSLKWDAAVNNYGYAVTSGGSDIKYGLEKGEYDMSYLSAGNYNVQVCAQGNGGTVLASPYSKIIPVTRLESVTNVRINTTENEGTLLFDTPANIGSADSVTYKVAFDSETNAFDYNSLGNINSRISTTGTTILVWAECNDYSANGTYFMSSRASENKEVFYRLQAPTISKMGAFAGQTTFTWNAPAGLNTAEYTPQYSVSESNVENIYYNDTPLKSNVLDISSLPAGLHKFYVKAIGDGKKYVNSEYSELACVTKLAMPTIRVENGKYTWDSDNYLNLNNFEKCFVISTGEKTETLYFAAGNAACTYIPTFTSTGNKLITLYAKGDGQNGGTVDSVAYSFNQAVGYLDTPSFSFKYVNASGSQIKVVESGAKVRFTVTPGSNGVYAIGYRFLINGTPHLINANESNVYDVTLDTAGTYKLSVQAAGVGFDASGKAYINSNYSDQEALVILAKPSKSSFSYSKTANRISWGNVNGAVNYEYQIAYDGGSYGTSYTTSANQAAVIAQGHENVKIRVRALGNSSGSIIGSEWTEYTINF